MSADEPESWETLRNDLDGLFPEDENPDCNDAREAVLSLVRAAHLAGQQLLKDSLFVQVEYGAEHLDDALSIIRDFHLLDPDKEEAE